MIGIIVPGNKKYMPYIQNYINILDAKNIQYKVLSWNKTGMQEENIGFSYDFVVKDSNRKKMFLGYLGFVRGCRRYIKKNHIDRLIILTAAPAFFLGMPFLNRFKQKYLIDIRDDSPLIRRFPAWFKKICAGAHSVVVSSNQFSPWTGRETVLCHNADVTQIKKRLHSAPKQQCGHPISLVFAGMLNEGKINLEMLRHIGSDDRFRFAFVGKECFGKDLIRQFAQEQNLENITFQGTYNKDDIYDIYHENADLVNIIRAKNTVNRNALPNKLYDAVMAGVPVVVFDHNEAIAAYVQEYNLGLVLEEDMETLGDTIVKEMAKFDYAAYAAGRTAFLQKVMKDLEQFKQLLEQFSEA